MRMATQRVTNSTTLVEQVEQSDTTQQETLVLRLRARSHSPPHVTWAAGTIDNEHLGRLKSNCCCIWVKPRKWDDPSTWEQDEHEVNIGCYFVE
uniref:E3 ubiquitin-protein ligase PPP1R11 n=1 Tax=Parascaris univalens TaxID=6257 RepID=A0A915CD66_PARUN